MAQVAKTGLSAQSPRMTVIANNLVNVNTVGFKRCAQFEDLLYQRIVQASASGPAKRDANRAYACTEQELCLQKDYRQGNIFYGERSRLHSWRWFFSGTTGRWDHCLYT